MRGINKKIEIRVAGKNDAQLISLLARVTFTETFGHLFRDRNDLLQYYDRTFSVEKIKNSLSKSANIYWIARVDDLPVGYAKMKLNSGSDFTGPGKLCQLQKIYVLKDFLSMKIGFELQNNLLKKARELEFDMIWLSVLNSNNRAINFYRKSGYETFARHDFHIGKESFDFIAMQKNLK